MSAPSTTDVDTGSDGALAVCLGVVEVLGGVSKTGVHCDRDPTARILEPHGATLMWKDAQIRRDKGRGTFLITGLSKLLARLYS